MKRNLRIETDTYRVRMSAHCGMSVDIADGETEPRARQIAARYLRRRKRAGYALYKVGPGLVYELTEPETAIMVPDDAGLLSIDRETVPAWKCWNCGDVLPCGTGCTCQDPDGDA